MTEKSIRKLVYKIILEDEMGKWLVRGIKMARGEKIDDKKDNKKTYKDKKNISFMLADKSKIKDFETKFDDDELKKNLEKLNIKSKKEKDDVIEFFLNLNRFFNNSNDYDFEKKIVNVNKKEIFDEFVFAGIDVNIRKYFIEKYNFFKRNLDRSKLTPEIKKLEQYI
jgi:hypothetical protein